MICSLIFCEKREETFKLKENVLLLNVYSGRLVYYKIETSMWI